MNRVSLGVALDSVIFAVVVVIVIEVVGTTGPLQKSDLQQHVFPSVIFTHLLPSSLQVV